MNIPSSQLASLEAEFKLGVYDRAHEIDPNNEQDWFSLTLGWALGKGLIIQHAHDFAIYIRYHTELG